MRTGKVLRKTGKILLITILSLLVFVLIVVGIALNSENTITGLALDEVSEMFDAPVEVDDVSLRLFMNFPYATVEFSGFKLGASGKKQPNMANVDMSDTLLSLRKLYVSLKSRPLLNNKIEIQKVEVEGFAFNYYTDSAGGTNLDFLMESDTTATAEPEDTTVVDTTSSVLDVLLSNLTIRDVTVNYKDQSMGAAARVHIPEMDISGRILDEYYKGSLKGEVVLTNTHFEGTKLSLMNRTSLGFMIDYEDGNVEIESVDFLTDGAELKAKGKAKLGDSIFVDMGIDLNDIDLEELSKYTPDELIKEFGIETVKGKINVATKVNGYYYDTLLLPKVQTHITFNDGHFKLAEYPEIHHLSFDGTVDVPDANNMKTMRANFKSFKVKTAKSDVRMAFDVTNFEKPVYKFNSDINVTLDEFTDFLPDSTVEYLTGKIGLSINTYGELPDDLGMNSADYFLARTSLDLKIRDFSTAMDSATEVKNMSMNFAYRPNKRMELTNVKLEAPGYDVVVKDFILLADILGQVRDMDNMGLDIDSLYVDLGDTKFDLKGRLKGLERAEFDIVTNLDVDIDQWQSYIPKSDVEHITGKISFGLKSFGEVHLDSVETQIMPIAFEQSEVKLKVREFDFAMPDDTLSTITDLNLDFAMADDTMRIDDLHVNWHGIDYWLDSTEIWNVYKSYFLQQKDKKLIVNTYMKLSDIDYAMFEPMMAEDTTQTDSANASASQQVAANEPQKDDAAAAQSAAAGNAEATAEATEQAAEDTTESYMPQYIVRGEIAVASLKYGDIFIEDISTKFRVDDSLYVLDKFKLKGFGGHMVTSAVYDMREDTIDNIYFKNEIFGMDINQLLVDADDFDQEEFTHENISGVLTSSLDGRIIMNDTAVFYDKINMLGRFKLEDGGLYNYEPVSELSKYTGMKELDSIVFKTMESSVFIYKNKIYFPQTDIVSTALDMSAYGMQSFDDDYEYHFKVHLSDVLFGKRKKLLEEQGFDDEALKDKETGERKGLELVAKDIGGESKYGRDNERAQKMMKTRIRLQDRGLSFIFHPRLVNFSTAIDREKYRIKEEDEADK